MRVCDRCGKDTANIELVANKNDLLSKFTRALESAIVWKPEPIERVDLCEECYKDFKNWLQEKKQ